MKGRLRVWAGALAPAAIVLSVPASSFATGTYVTHGGFSTYAIVRGEHGFKVKFAETSRRRFRLTVKGHQSTTSYATKGGSAEGGRVSADLGRRGSFDLRFAPVGRPETIKVPGWCEGRPGAWQRGYLVGRFRFRGERDFTRVRGLKVPAAHESWSPLRCHYARGGERSRVRDAPRAHVSAWRDERQPSRSVGFGAALFSRHDHPAGERVQVRAWTATQAGKVFVQREIAVAAPEDTISFPDGPNLPEEVTVSPPAPFTGSADFVRTPESAFTWAGDLAVEFPGLGPIRLSGPCFGVRVCAPEGCVSTSRNSNPPEGEL